MALRKLERRNYGGEWPMSIKYQNNHSFKEGLILLCQSILATRRITHILGSAHFTIPLMHYKVVQKKLEREKVPRLGVNISSKSTGKTLGQLL